MSFGQDYAYSCEKYLSLSRPIPYDDAFVLLLLLFTSIAYSSKGILWARPDPFRHKLFERPQVLSGVTRNREVNRDLETRLNEKECLVAILWASQSGTTERLATRLANDLNQIFSIHALLLDVSEIEPSSITRLSANKIVILMTSTFGEGDPPDNMHSFWSWITESDINRSHCSHLRFTGFGLGNSNYKYYNHVMVAAATNLQAKGAELILDIGLADDAFGSTDEDFLYWKDRLLSWFQQNLGLRRANLGYVPTVRVEVLQDRGSDLFTPALEREDGPQSRVFASPTQRLAIIESCDLLHNSPDRKCLHFEFDLSQHPRLKYKTGDYIDIWATNPDSEITLLLSLLELDSDSKKFIRVQSLNDVPSKVHIPMTIDTLFRHNLEICSPVSREHVALLSNYAPDDEARLFLSHLSDKRETWNQYTKHHHVNLGRLLQSANSTQGAWRCVPLSMVIEILPAMKPRSYSISSSSIVQPRHASITVSVADSILASTNERIPGLVSKYLDNQNEITSQRKVRALTLGDEKVTAAIRRSNFKLPNNASAPILMIGAGSGIAPFRAFVQERARLKEMGKEVGLMKLIFGCRNPQQDNLYAKDLETWGRSLDRFFTMTTSFSRPTDGSEKQYVQDAVLADPNAITDMLIDQNAYFYICGSSAVARDVAQAVAHVLVTTTGWSESKCTQFIESQKRARRWLQDVWG